MTTLSKERLRLNFSEGGAQEIYQAIQTDGDFLGFAQQYAFDPDHRVARSALWGLTKASRQELSQMKPLLNSLIDQAMQTDDSSRRRLTLNIIERLEMTEEDLRTDFLDFCLEHMADVKEFPGIQTLCMKLAFHICQFYPELCEELHRTLQDMDIDYYKPAIKCLRSRILSGRYK